MKRHVNVYIHTYIHTNKQTNKQTNTHTHAHTYLHTYIHIYTYTHLQLGVVDNEGAFKRGKESSVWTRRERALAWLDSRRRFLYVYYVCKNKFTHKINTVNTTSLLHNNWWSISSSQHFAGSELVLKTFERRFVWLSFILQMCVSIVLQMWLSIILHMAVIWHTVRDQYTHTHTNEYIFAQNQQYLSLFLSCKQRSWRGTANVRPHRSVHGKWHIPSI
jgi:hypothetical protein